MFWLFENNNKINFLQIFIEYKKFEDNEASCINYVYNFDKKYIETEELKYNDYDFTKIKPIIKDYIIKMKDGYIQYIDKTKLETFNIENEFINETNEINEYKLPYFKWKYTKTDKYKMPNLIEENYDFYYKKLKFKIYKLSNDKLFIVEINDNICKKYVLQKIY
jgi:hypothetical protein